MRTLVVIPARSGSKGIRGKNWKEFAGKPLILHTLEQAMRLFAKEDIVLSTDSNEVLDLAYQCGMSNIPLRPAELSQDGTSMQEVLLYELSLRERKNENYDAILLLQPTSPLRTDEDIVRVLGTFNESMDMALTMCKTKHNPYSVILEENEKGYLEKSKKHASVSRQTAPVVFLINGAVYLMSVNSLKSKKISDFEKVKGVEMPEIRSIDIDTPWDWEVAELAWRFCQMELNTF